MKSNKSTAAPSSAYLRFQQAGEKALQEKQFDSAKRAFDHAILQVSHDPNRDTSTLISILDLRLEARLKLGDFDAAVKDARTMLRYDRTDARGYLRCGQLARLKSEFAGAQTWYQQGLKNVPQNHEGYRKLASLSAKSIDKSAAPPNKCRDPLTVLPLEIIHMVYRYLDLQEATSCLRVSRLWRNSLLATHCIWNTFDLTGIKIPMIVRHLKACIRRLPNPPTTVRLNKLTPTAVTHLSEYLRAHWNNTLEHLSIDLPHLLDLDSFRRSARAVKSLHLGVRCPVDFKSVSDLLRSCNTLRYARFDAILKSRQPSDPIHDDLRCEWEEKRQKTPLLLAHLALTAVFRPWEGDERFIDPSGLFHDLPNLEELQCSGFAFRGLDADLSKAKCLRQLILRDCRPQCDLRLPSSLEVLICKETHCPPWPVPHPLLGFQQHAENVQTLFNLKVLEMDLDGRHLSRVFRLIKDSPTATLTRLDLSGSDMAPQHLRSLLAAGKLSQLTFLGLRHIDLLDEHVQSIAVGCPMLEHVEFSGLRITGVAIKELCMRTQIKELRLSACSCISADAIAWARAREITVVIQEPECRRTSARRVRYG
ncbi:hypothetical protein EPUS_02933 [Endocarpon pusillum Z07020]|uniref:F-box domain-containing protein n=1 Tax=Endocarpon pusillum (strain Z07020 / HMAS-L-300199) TaxID=1263415 RepID=U1G4D0_ENDPU|nr:uncharacterized protein EPUS_02933 [Endocarpon pusillum Z07020]ERF72142.1 hypothetical protein EPUS_02933 [Endocarpon pusillum Z07020]